MLVCVTFEVGVTGDVESRGRKTIVATYCLFGPFVRPSHEITETIVSQY